MEALKHLMTDQVPAELLNKTGDMPKFQKQHYFSRTAGRQTPLNVLLPESYDGSKFFPVLYVLHGYFDNEDWMARDVVGLEAMAHNLQKLGQMEECIIVLPYIYCSPQRPCVTGMNLENSLSYDHFINDLLLDVMPFVEKNYCVKPGRENTAVTGFSMGGREALFTGFSHPELFCYVGACCPAPGLTPIPGSKDHPGQIQPDNMRFDKMAPHVLFISAAAGDPAVSNFPLHYHAQLQENGVEHLWLLMKGKGHDHTSVTPHLYSFMRMIFRAG